MKTNFALIVCLAAWLLSGCAGFKASKDDLNAVYDSEDLDELLHFGSDMANKSASSRAEVCQALLNRRQAAPSTGVQLHLLTGRLLSDDCGDIGDILQGIDGATLKTIADEPVRSLVAAQMEALRRMDNPSQNESAVKRKPKTAQHASESKKRKPEPKPDSKKEASKPQAVAPTPPKTAAKPPLGTPDAQKPAPKPQLGQPGTAEAKKPSAEPPKGEADFLRDKLDAIRSMEKKLDDSGGGH